MPKMYISALAGTFDAKAREGLAADLTDLGIRCEKLADTPFVRSTVWVYYHDYAQGYVFGGGVAATSKIVSLVVYTLRGGLAGEALKQFISEATAMIGLHAGTSGRVPAFIVVREVDPRDWGLFGQEGSLEAMRTPSDAQPI